MFFPSVVTVNQFTQSSTCAIFKWCHTTWFCERYILTVLCINIQLCSVSCDIKDHEWFECNMYKSAQTLNFQLLASWTLPLMDYMETAWYHDDVYCRAARVSCQTQLSTLVTVWKSELCRLPRSMQSRPTSCFVSAQHCECRPRVISWRWASSLYDSSSVTGHSQCCRHVSVFLGHICDASVRRVILCILELSNINTLTSTLTC